MKTKLGRPEMPQGKANTKLIHLRVSGEIEKNMGNAAASSYEEKPEWMRKALKSAVNNAPVWVKSKWGKNELHDKTVEFKLTAPDHYVKGRGVFRILENPKGELRIDISVITHDNPPKITEYIYHLYQPTADKIEINPDSKRSDFRVSA